MTKFEDNLSPYLTVVEQGSTPANPSSGDQKLFVRTSDHVLCRVNSSGTVVPITGGVATDPIWAAAGDLAVGTGASTAAVLASGAVGTVLSGAGVGVAPTWAAPLGAWTTYTPTWTQSSTNPTLGNGTVAGRYKLLDAHTLAVQIELVTGTTTTCGTGDFLFALPTGMTVGSALTQQALAADLLQAGVTNYPAICQAGAGNAYLGPLLYPGGNVVAQASPFIWDGGSTGNAVRISGIIEIA